MRKFYKKVIQVEILSEEPIPDHFTLSMYDYEITEGAFSGQINTISNDEVDGKTMAELLISQGSDPEFMNLREDGEDFMTTCSLCETDVYDYVMIGREGDKPRPFCWDCAELDEGMEHTEVLE